MEAAYLLQGILDYAADLLHVAGAAVLVCGLLPSRRFMFAGGAVHSHLFPLLSLLLLRTLLFYFLLLLALGRAIAGAPLLVLCYCEHLYYTLLIRLGRAWNISMNP